jgi:hypothetical protein
VQATRSPGRTKLSAFTHSVTLLEVTGLSAWFAETTVLRWQETNLSSSVASKKYRHRNNNTCSSAYSGQGSVDQGYPCKTKEGGNLNKPKHGIFDAILKEILSGATYTRTISDSEFLCPGTFGYKAFLPVLVPGANCKLGSLSCLAEPNKTSMDNELWHECCACRAKRCKAGCS